MIEDRDWAAIWAIASARLAKLEDCTEEQLGLALGEAAELYMRFLGLKQDVFIGEVDGTKTFIRYRPPARPQILAVPDD